MNGRLRLGLLALVTVALAAISIQPQTLTAQEASARFRVLVPDVPPQNDASKKFGERLADELRDLINDMATHQPVEEKEIKDALKRFDMKMEDLNCIRTRQLGQQIQAELVFCGTYTREGEGWRVEGSFVGANGEALEVEPVTVEDRGQRAAAQHFFASLELLVEQVRYAQFCGDYASSQQWETALENCNRAIELNPNTVESRYTRAMVLRQEEVNRLEEALEEFKRILELDPLHEDAMQNAGYVSALMGNDEDARAYYSSYLELNPANAAVRMGVAYQLAQAGDPLGAMQLIEVGLELEPENVDLLKQHGGFAFAAGAELAAGQEMIPVEAAELYRKALQSFSSVYEIEGAEMEVAQLRSIINAHLNLQEYPEAVEFAERILETHGEDAQVWSVYADALQRAERVDEAIDALERVRQLDPEYPNVSMRQGNWLLNSGRVDDAMPVFREAIQRGEQSPDAVVNLLFSNGYNEGVRTENWDYGIRVIRLTREFDASPEIAQRSLFWLGYSLYRRASVQQEPQTLETAQATLPQFEAALGYLSEAASYAQANNLEGDRQNLLNATNTYIEIQVAIIRRGR